MNNRAILAVSSIMSDPFKIELNLVSYEEEGLSFFNEKWVRSKTGPIVDTGHSRWDCTYYTVGRDCTVEQAQKEFNRDCEAFDVSLFATVSLNDVVLLKDEAIIGADYNYEEDAEKLLADLLFDYVDVEALVKKAEEERLEIIKNLTI